MADPTAHVNVGEDFEAGKGVVEILKDLPRDRQERVLRWVTESLGIASPVAPRLAPTQHLSPILDPTTPQPAKSLQPTDIKSFMAEKRPRSDMQFVTVAAYYYRFEAPELQRRETVTTEVIQEAARQAGHERLHNPKSTLNNARNQGYLDRRAPGEFAINTVGENLVAMALPGDGETSKKGAKTKPGRKRAGRKKKRSE